MGSAPISRASVILDEMNIWKEGRYLDAWSVNHLLSGAIFTGWLLTFGLNILIIFFLHLVLAIVWEIFEALFGICEHLSNRIMDVVVGNIGFFLVYIFSINFYVLIALTSLYLFMQILGYLAYRKRVSIKK